MMTLTFKFLQSFDLTQLENEVNAYIKELGDGVRFDKIQYNTTKITQNNDKLIHSVMISHDIIYQHSNREYDQYRDFIVKFGEKGNYTIQQLGDRKMYNSLEEYEANVTEKPDDIQIQAPSPPSPTVNNELITFRINCLVSHMLYRDEKVIHDIIIKNLYSDTEISQPWLKYMIHHMVEEAREKDKK